ncbi:hypothetical protein [Streptomyces sp. KL116D]|uniref:hypothetical protein n=1 Tax=Streptomyces sp. KL116D TaxID=3045152 RepID=UPI003557B718
MTPSDLLTPDEKETATPTPSPSASGSTASKDVGDAVKDTVDTVEGTVRTRPTSARDASQGHRGRLWTRRPEEAAKAAEEAKDRGHAVAAEPASGIPTTACGHGRGRRRRGHSGPAAGHHLALEASSLLLKGATTRALVDVRMADGSNPSAS